MNHFASDYHRLHCVLFELWQEGIDISDVQNATALGQVFGSPEAIRQYGRDPTDPINRVCVELIKRAESLLELKKAGAGAPTRSGGAIPASTISFLAWEMLLRCNHDGVLPPTSLLELLRLQLEIRSEAIARDEEINALKMAEAAVFSYCNPEKSFREIAEIFEVDVATVSRWNKKYDLKSFGEGLHKSKSQMTISHGFARQSENQAQEDGEK